MHGVRCYPALEDLPEAPDAVVVAIPAGDAPDVVARASALGCGGAVVFAAGFAEARETELQHALAVAANGLPVCGPNGNGIVSLPDRVALWGDTIEPREAGPGRADLADPATSRSTRSPRGAGCGCTRSSRAATRRCSTRPTSSRRCASATACARSRSTSRPTATARAGARRCRRRADAGIGVAVLKAGRSRAGAAAAEAHTGALAGDQRVFRALFEELGAAWAEDPHDLLELAKALASRRAGASAGGPAVPPADTPPPAWRS